MVASISENNFSRYASDGRIAAANAKIVVKRKATVVTIVDMTRKPFQLTAM